MSTQFISDQSAPATARQYEHPSVWLGPDMAARKDWVVQLDDDDIAQLEAALAMVKAKGIGIPGMTSADFPLHGATARKMQAVLSELEHGRGFALVRGLPVMRYTKRDASLIYWGLGTHFGHCVAQNAQGEVLGHVRNLGVDWASDQRARGYQTRDFLPYHVDSSDVVGLLCLRRAKSAGISRLVSSTALHNAIAASRPDLWKLLCEPFYVDRRSEEGPGRKPYYVTPCFNYLHGRLYVFFNFLIESAQRFPEVPRLTDAQREALALMVTLANDPAFYLEMDLEPGDMQFLCNYEILHSRTAYEDWPEPDRKRHLMRLWLRTPGFGQLPAAYADRASDIETWQRTPMQPIFDNSEIISDLAD